MGSLKRRIIKDMEPTEYELARRWIPVTERLPEDGIKVLVCFKGEIDSIEIRDFLGGLGGVTHWMPLPAPPTDAK